MTCDFCGKDNRAVRAVPKHNINGNQPHGLACVCGNARCIEAWIKQDEVATVAPIVSLLDAFTENAP